MIRPQSPILALVLLLAACLHVGGCASSSSLEIESLDADVTIVPVIRTQIARHVDENTIDIYLSDIPEDRLLAPARRGGFLPAAGTGIDDPSPGNGTILHIRMFVNPRAGRTPIESSASNTTMTCLIIADSIGDNVIAGRYGGGGFLLPTTPTTAATFHGSINDGSLRLVSRSPRFADRLGLCEIHTTIAARRDDAVAEGFGAWFRQFVTNRTPASPADDVLREESGAE